MSHTPNELSEEFPDRTAQMSALKQSNAHFAKLFEEYHEINRAVHRAEVDVEPTDDMHMSDMRKQRLAIKDELYSMLLAEDA